jgi:GNAT superfamily N-acetyltransferase
MALQIRRATKADGRAAVNTLRRSITELCTADHQDDPRKLASWLSNKTVDAWANWLATEGMVVLVADRNEDIVGVGMANLKGEILLNYVHPEARFTGVSKALLAALEVELRLHRITQCRLQSTITARLFYHSCGYGPETDNAFVLSKAL